MSGLENKANYYSIIPGQVMYDKSLTANAKILYALIGSLCEKEGFCWASNEYLAELNGVTKNAISGWIKQLEKAGHIQPIVHEKKGNSRCIYLTVALPNRFVRPTKNELTPTQKRMDSPTQPMINTPYIERKDSKSRYARTLNPPTVDEVIKFFIDNGKTEARAIEAFEHYTKDGAEWHDSHGNKVINWKQKMRINWFKNYDNKKTTATQKPRGYTDEELFAPFNEE